MFEEVKQLDKTEACARDRHL